MQLEIRGLTKRFGATLALDRADLSLRHGTVHALVGGNGCGKSTTIKVLAGVHRADGGRIEIAGTTWDAVDYDARAGRSAGLRFVHQDGFDSRRSDVDAEISTAHAGTLTWDGPSCGGILVRG